MALVTTDDSRNGSTAIVVFDPGQRHNALRAARRHSVFVYLLRAILPVAAVALLGSYAIFLQFSTKIEDDTHKGTFKMSSVDFLTTKPTMRNPSYTGFNKKDGSEYSVRAEKAITDLDEKKPIDLYGITARIKQSDGTVADLSSEEGRFHRAEDRLDLFKNIIIRTSNGMAARLTEASIHTKRGIILSKKPVAVRFPAGTLQGNTMQLHQKKREVFFASGVVARLDPKKAQTKPGTASAPKKPGTSSKKSGGLEAFAGQSDAPVLVKAPQLKVYDEKSTAQFLGGVTATQDDARLQSQTMDVHYKGAAESSTSVQRIIARDSVVITRGADRITTTLANFDVIKNTAHLTGDVVITSGVDRRIMSEKAIIDTENDNILLIGQVVASQGQNLLRGNRLDFNQKTGRMVLTSPGKKNGRIEAHFVREDQGQTGKATKPDKVKPKGSGPLAGQAFQTQPGAPIKVEAARLDVDDTKHQATFRGDVRAVQGDFIVRTEVLHATYTGSAGLELDSGSAAKADGPSGAQLRSIYAPSKIIVESTTGQYAAGDSGRFNIETNEIELIGNVILKRGRQLVRGQNLAIDLTNGLSRIQTGSGRSWQPRNQPPEKPAGGKSGGFKPETIADSTNTRACGGRMCAMFYPSDIKGNGANKKKTKAPRTTPSSEPAKAAQVGAGWSSSTTENAPIPAN